MFRSATTRIAHNAHLPGIAQAAMSKDLKALQGLINAEKAVQQRYVLASCCAAVMG